MFTTENTNGTFTDAQLDLMNAALTLLVAQGVDEASASAQINNRITPEDHSVETLTDTAPAPWAVVDGLFSDEARLSVVGEEDLVVNYAEACGHSIDYRQAARIAAVVRWWIHATENGGEWSRYRHEARELCEHAGVVSFAPAVKAPESLMVRVILAAKAAAGPGAYLSLHNSGECILWPSEGASVNDDGRRAVGWWQVATVWEAEELTKTGAVDEHASGLRLVKPTWLVKPTFA